jgi:hypothetical protein
MSSYDDLLRRVPRFLHLLHLLVLKERVFFSARNSVWNKKKTIDADSFFFSVWSCLYLYFFLYFVLKNVDRTHLLFNRGVCYSDVALIHYCYRFFSFLHFVFVLSLSVVCLSITIDTGYYLIRREIHKDRAHTYTYIYKREGEGRNPVRV